MNSAIDLNSSRTKQARVAVLLQNRLLQIGLLFAALICVMGGFTLVLSHQSIGWFVIGLVSLPLMPFIWYEWWLKDLPPVKDAKTVDGLLESDLLGRLSPSMTPQQIATAVMQTNGGLFFAVRVGIGPVFLRDMSSNNLVDSDAVWQSALQLRQELGLHNLSSAVVAAALIRNVPNRDQLLGQLQITFDDVQAAAKWYHHLHDLIANQRHIKRGGGIGRDLSFGWTPQLNRFALNISNQVTYSGSSARQLEGHTVLLDQLVQQLARGGRQNAVLVGPNGAGKTTLVYALADRLLRDGAAVPNELHYRQVLALDPASLISQAKGRGEIEGLMNQLLLEAYHAKNVILFLDNAELFFSDQTGAVDLRNILLPILEAGSLRMILSMDEQQWLKLGQASPGLTQQLNRLTVPAMSEPDTLLVCEDQLMQYEFRNKVTYMYQALRAAHRLGGRYVADLAMPGQALKLLESAAQFAQNGLVTAASVEQAVEKTYGVKVSNASQGDERTTLLNLEDLLHKRMVNQVRAVNVVASALRRARSGVRNQNRPIGSFLFLGPTGVGKTELAKALAATYFGGEDHIVRLDLNEFGQASDVSRLIAAGATDSRSLTAQISKQPFSVVLLDEIEKAHPNVLNTLLQLLDEGILRDSTNREISFRDAIVIATSNAGADRIREYIDAGYKMEQFEEKFVNELIDRQTFKPEFLNRFDEIVLFRSLTEEELLQVVDLMLASVNKTLSQQHLSVTVADDAKLKLVQAGIDPRLGARPLRRIVQRTVEDIVAKRVLSDQATPGQTIALSLSDIEEALKR